MSKKSILLIDDEETILASLRYVLEDEGYDVHTANSGSKGLEIFKEKKPDLIITDLMLNGLNGIDLLKRVKDAKPDIMVIIITGFGELNSAIEALKLGAMDYLLKPVKNKELVLRITNCFDRLKMQIEIKAFEKLAPICSFCRKIRDDFNKAHGTGEWVTIEEFLEKHTDMSCSHGICPDCFDENKKELENSMV